MKENKAKKKTYTLNKKYSYKKERNKAKNNDTE